MAASEWGWVQIRLAAGWAGLAGGLDVEEGSKDDVWASVLSWWMAVSFKKKVKIGGGKGKKI